MKPTFATYTYLGEQSPHHHLCVRSHGVVHSACGMMPFDSMVKADIDAGRLVLEDTQPKGDMCPACSRNVTKFVKEKMGGKKPKIRPIVKQTASKEADNEYFDQDNGYIEDALFTLLREKACQSRSVSNGTKPSKRRS